MFDRLNLDDWGGERFDPQKVNYVFPREVNGLKVHRARFELSRSFSEKKRDPFVWQDRLGDWRRLERTYRKAAAAHGKAAEQYWRFMRQLWDKTRKICGKRVESFYIQLLPPPGQKISKKEKIYVNQIQLDRNSHRGNVRLTMSGAREEKMDPQDARDVWIWLGSAEELEFNRLRRRDDCTRMRQGLAYTAFVEAVKTRLSSWLREHTKDDYYGHCRNVFVAIENDGRSYGYLCKIGHIEPVWAPPERPRLFV